MKNTEVKKLTKEDILNWMRSHKKGLITGGCIAATTIASIVIFKKCKVNTTAARERSRKAEEGLINYLNECNAYRVKYPDILDGGVNGYDKAGMWFIADKVINVPVDFSDVNGEPDVATLAINEVVNKVIDKIDLNDISMIEMMVDLK